MKVSPKQIINSLKSVVGSVYKEGVDQILSWPQTDERGYLKFRFRGGIQVYDCEISPEGIISYIEAQRSDSILLGSYFGPIAQYIEDSTYAQGLLEAEIMRIDGKKCRVGKSCGNTCITVNAKCSQMLGLKQKQVINNIREAVSQKAEKTENKPNGWGVAAAIGAGVVGTALVGGGVAGAIALSGGFGGGGKGGSTQTPPSSPPPNPPQPPPEQERSSPKQPNVNRSSPKSKVKLVKDRHGYKVAGENTSRQLLDDSFNLIESIHPVGEVKDIPVKLVTDQPDSFLAAYRFGVDINSRKIVESTFTVNKNAVFGGETEEEAIGNAKATIIHEIGHALDHKLFGGDQFGTGAIEEGGVQKGDLKNPKLKSLMNAIDNSDAVKGVKSARDKAYRNEPISGWASPTREAAEYFDYLDMPTEKFARAYAQYISDKSKDIHLQGAIANKVIEGDEAPSQWSKKDFEAIEKEFDKLFGR